MTVIPGPWPGPRGCPCETCQGQRRHPSPPTAEYLAVRQRLGIPSQPDVIWRRCPWCDVAPGQPCRVPGTGKIRQPHEARTEPAQAEGAS